MVSKLAILPLLFRAKASTCTPKHKIIYASNAVQANIKAMLAEGISIEDCKKEISDNSCNSRIYNVAVGDRTGLIDMWQSLRKIANTLIRDNSSNSRIVEAIHGPERVGDIRDSLADISKAENSFGYEPKFKLHQGLEKTFNWFISDKNLTNK